MRQLLTLPSITEVNRLVWTEIAVRGESLAELLNDNLSERLQLSQRRHEAEGSKTPLMVRAGLRLRPLILAASIGSVAWGIPAIGCVPYPGHVVDVIVLTRLGMRPSKQVALRLSGLSTRSRTHHSMTMPAREAPVSSWKPAIDLTESTVGPQISDCLYATCRRCLTTLTSTTLLFPSPRACRRTIFVTSKIRALVSAAAARGTSPSLPSPARVYRTAVNIPPAGPPKWTQERYLQLRLVMIETETGTGVQMTAR